MSLQLKGKKQGMTQCFDKAGNIIACTVIHAEPSVIVQLKNKERDGYAALQLGFEKIEVNDERTLKKRRPQAVLGHFKKANIAPHRHLFETRVDSLEGYEVGQSFSVAIFKDISHVDVTGISKGKGYQGVMKLHGFSGGRATHGSGFHRHGGSMGQRSTPGRTFPGKKKAGRMGSERITLQGLKVIAVDEEQNLLVVEGSVPGCVGSLLTIAPAIKKIIKNKKKR